MKLTAARVFVADLAAATRFYEGALGLRVGARGPEAGYVVFEAGNVDLVVEHVAPGAPSEEQALVGRFTGLSFSVKGIEAVCVALQEKGVVFTGPPERQAWGGTLATLRDPSQNELQLVEYPSAT
jgi:catechol 2,3-dioxygenase-like lactoylglutathione lyase family enzyme